MSGRSRLIWKEGAAPTEMARHGIDLDGYWVTGNWTDQEGRVRRSFALICK